MSRFSKYSHIQTNEEWVGILLLGRINNEAITTEERKSIVDYLISTKDMVTARVLELLNLVTVKGDLNVTIAQLKTFRINMLFKIKDKYVDLFGDDMIVKRNMAPLNKEIRKHLKFWIPDELENEIAITETFERAMQKIEDSITGIVRPVNKPRPRLTDCQGEHVCKKVVVDFRE